MDNNTLKGFTIQFQLYAHNEQEVDEARRKIINFIDQHARQGRAVTAEKVGNAIDNWEANPIVRNHIINYFK